MKIAVTADIHSFIPEIPHDISLLLIAGDFVLTGKYNYIGQAAQLNNKYIPWINSLEDKGIKVLFISGNHETILEDQKYLVNLQSCKGTYLEDSSSEFMDLKVHGSPQNKRFFDWAFNKTEQQLQRYWDLIPEDTNILLVHQPPYGYGDLTEQGEHVGSYTLLDKIRTLKNLSLVCTGHIHFNYGVSHLCGKFGNDIMVVNASYCNEKYEAQNSPVVIEI